MRMLLFSSQHYDQESFERASSGLPMDLHFQPARLTLDTAPLAHGYPAVCAFINDELDASVLELLAAGGTQLIALRSAGYNHVDLPAAERLGLTVVRVPAYSPHAVAEHAVALVMALNRRLHRAYNRTREGDFTLHGLTGFDLHGKTVGVVGTGQIGEAFARIMAGFGCQLLAHDPYPNPRLLALGARYMPLPELLRESRIVSLHCPLNDYSHHLINAQSLAQMQHGAMLINTGRGALVDTPALIEALKSGQLGYLGLDVYEEEAQLFFQDRSDQPLQDDVLARLLTFPNVIITAHQAFLTREALDAIAATTLANVIGWTAGNPQNVVRS
ncbi:2-hydroxyacid dehydrogenase [Pseudomonas sp. RP23018S]|uniref:2-hydroxyacid dehydrogenase n=1 Tax=Pseudomonas sp. RP23018S TaxID=3096037 RepID=UPI002ACA72E1|nr:2-hydroxyacid dehydrogenase [Pseudomonas sp. RP23018S]MDZ5601392.1 2-hydroxyacid dehydrogenase [Pseudomonas sp. RP23018S]